MRANLLHLALAFSFLGLWTATAAGQDKAATDSPAARYKMLLKEFDKAQQDYAKRLEGTKSLAEQAKVFREESPHPAFAGRFLELARNHPKDPVAHASLSWILMHSECGPAAEKPYTTAVKLMAAQYADHPGNEKLFGQMVISPFASSGIFLQAVYEKHSDPAVRGRAGFHLALFLKNYSDTVYQLGIMPVWAKNVELMMGPDQFRQLKNTDTAPLLRQAEDIFVKVQKDYPLVEYKRTFLVKAAEGELFELRHLAIGKTAPDIEGEDTDGKKFKLSDYRGKVVLLVFWGTWCGHCMAMLPQERALVKRLEGQPFAIVGVNSDTDRDKLKPVLAKERITWRSFWDASDTISTRWNVQGWPAIYVLDANGVIRSKQMRDEMLDRAVTELMKEVKSNR